MTDIEKLDDIIARLEIADWPDRAMDAEIDALVRFGPKSISPDEDRRWIWQNFPKWRVSGNAGRCEVIHDDGASGVSWESFSFTSSLDAAVALCEWLFPSEERSFGENGVDEPWATVRFHPLKSVKEQAPTMPLAICCAAIKAYRASLKSKEAA